MKVFTKTLSYARAGDVAKLLKDTRVLSSRGSALVDDRTNTLIINDLPEAITESENLIGILDRSEPQVEIEAKIVQTGTHRRGRSACSGAERRMASELATLPLSFPAQAGERPHQQRRGPTGPGANVPSTPCDGRHSALGFRWAP
jgi:hypothetical protein